MTEAGDEGVGVGVAAGTSSEGFRAPSGAQPLKLTLPATSANLGPGFDALGLAMSLTLTVWARGASDFSIASSGRDAHITGSLENNLIRTTYEEILRENGRAAVPLHLVVENEIPVGMGCGSSAAALCAGVLLANHFGGLEWSSEQVMDEAARREGHPDNVAACLLGGLTASKTVAGTGRRSGRSQTLALPLGEGLRWRLLLALPHAALSTAKARGVLPDTYGREDAVQNVQATALLVAAFALDRPDLLHAATVDRLHQPYRMEICPLLKALLPLAGQNGIHAVTLSGAGPSVLLIADRDASRYDVTGAGGALLAEVLELSIGSGARSEAWVIA